MELENTGVTELRVHCAMEFCFQVGFTQLVKEQIILPRTWTDSG